MKDTSNRTGRLEIRLDPKEKQAFQLAAESAGLPVASWIRERLRRAARIELEEIGKQIPFLTTGK